MITVAIARIVVFCARYALAVIAAFVLITILAGVYAAMHFAINTNTENMLSADLPWRKQEIATNLAFPQRTNQLIAVIDGTTPEKAELAAAALTAKLAPQTQYFKSVVRPDGGPFFDKNGILFDSLANIKTRTQGLIKAQAFLGSLAADPSLRGIMGAFSQALNGVRRKQAKLEDLTRPFTEIAGALETLEAGQNPAFSWRTVLNGDKPKPEELRKFIAIQPVLDFANLQPGEAPTKVIRDTAAALGLTPENGVRLRLTGQVALSDEEFGTVKEGFLLNGLVTILVVVVLLWLALKQARIIVGVFVSLVSGLLITAALGLFLVGSLNLLSIAFAVLFVGLGVDFGIQFSVRYRSERHVEPDLQRALGNTARGVGGPLLLAAASTAAGFLSFWPTDYLGLSELGKIAGLGMVIAFLTSIMLLPAMLALTKPKGETADVGFRSLAVVDTFLEVHSYWIVGITLGLVLIGSPLLLHLQFDFNPLDLNSAATESVSTLLDLGKNPNTNTNTIDVLLPNQQAADELGAKLRTLPAVSGVRSLQSYLPADQDDKLAVIQDAAFFLENTLNPAQVKPTPTDAETVAALRATAKDLTDTAGAAATPAAEAARRLASAVSKLADGDPALRAKATDTLVTPLKLLLDQVRDFLQADKVSLDTLPADIKTDWQAANGQVRLEVSPNSTTNDNAFLHRFADEVRGVAPTAVGGPVFISAAADSIIKAFWEAGLWAIGSITIILFIVLRRVLDVALTLVPLMIAIVVTLELCVLLGWQLNYANIIALPLLLGVGVAFKIYYVMAWRSGEKHFLQLSLTRAVLFSAMATATAFGSLWLSHHPGTSSMGKLMALALLTTLAAATLFQPALLATRKHT